MPLQGLTLNDTLKDGNNANLALDSGPTFVSATTSSTSSTIAIGGVVSLLQFILFLLTLRILEVLKTKWLFKLLDKVVVE